jgi:parallel beta-helix repeat protein
LASFNQKGIYTWRSDNNNIIKNNISSSEENGIDVSASDGNKIKDNNLTNNSKGIYFSGSNDNIIGFNNLFENEYGVYFSASDRNNITNNSIYWNEIYGIRFHDSEHNTIAGNEIDSNRQIGIYIINSINNTISANKMNNNGILFSGGNVEYWNSHNIDTLNLVNGKTLYYIKNQQSGNVPNGAGQVILANCSNISVKNQEIINATAGILLGFSSYCNISVNNLASNYHYGIYLYKSMKNNINNNTVLNNNRVGTFFYYSDNNLVIENRLFSNENGILLHLSDYNEIFSNNVSYNDYGVKLEYFFGGSDYNRIVNNTIYSNQDYGIYFKEVSHNEVYHNNFINNTIQAYDFIVNGRWYGSYPLGGNYWSDYKGNDTYKGPKQDIPGNDGFGDTPYTNISGLFPPKDMYPLIEPYTFKPLENFTILRQGWNLISIPHIQNNQDHVKVLEMIHGWYDAVQWFDPNDNDDPWKHHKIGKPFGNDLFELNETMGFWIHITQPGDTIFLYNGTAPTSNQNIQIHEGWNMVGYPSLTNHNRTVGLNNLEFNTDVNAIQWYDAATKIWYFMDPDDPFVPGRGYWMHSRVDTTWEVPL